MLSLQASTDWLYSVSAAPLVWFISGSTNEEWEIEIQIHWDAKVEMSKNLGKLLDT